MSQLKLAFAAIQAPFWLNLFVEDYISQFSFPLSFPGDVFGDFLPTLARYTQWTNLEIFIWY